MASNYAGYTGKIMLVDLSSETVREYPWTDRDRELYLGGRIMANKILLDHLTGHEQAFSEENWIVITTGPLTLSGAPSSSRYDIAAISPASGLPAASNCGGDFGIHLKRAGYDGLILAGRCHSRRWLEIRNGEFIFHDAEDLWGTLCDDCGKQLDARMPYKKYGKLYIGPAGENCVRFASVLDGTHTSGRTGIGAVFGWKNLKAITVTGTHSPTVHEEDRFAQLKKECFTQLHNHPLTGKNSRTGTPTSKACPGCPILCRRQFNKGADSRTDYLNRLGMDSVSALDVAAWAQAAAEAGVLAVPLPEQEQLFEEMALRRGLGNDLAEGIRYLSKKYGFKIPKSKKSAAEKHNRNEGYPAILKGWGLDPETMPPQMKLDCAILYTDLCEAVSAAGLCMFTVNAFCPEYLLTEPHSERSREIHRLAPHSGEFLHGILREPLEFREPFPLLWQCAMLNALSGMALTPGDFLAAGARNAALEQLLCHRFGGDVTKLPKILAKDNLCTPQTYFATRGWSDQGVPLEQ